MRALNWTGLLFDVFLTNESIYLALPRLLSTWMLGRSMLDPDWINVGPKMFDSISTGLSIFRSNIRTVFNPKQIDH